MDHGGGGGGVRATGPHQWVAYVLLRFLLLRFLVMGFNDCWCISFTLSAAANPIIRDRMNPLHAVPMIANYLLGKETKSTC